MPEIDSRWLRELLDTSSKYHDTREGRLVMQKFSYLCAMLNLRSGYSLSCTECTSRLTTSCSGYVRVCPHGSVCGAAYIATSDVPADNPVPNGLKCPSCLSFYSPWCNSSDTMQCTGNENMCLLQTVHIGEAVPQSTAYRGCATKSICDLGNLCYSHNGILTDVRFHCTSGSTMGLQTHFYIPSIICLLFLKLQFVL
ncbi:phospholipase A2 inhibitor NAI-like [Lithobates pipiens]